MADARQRLRVNGMSFRTVDQTRLIVDARDDCLVTVVVSRIGEEDVVLVISWASNTEYILSFAPHLVRPVAAVQSVVIHQSFRMAGLAFWNAPRA